VSEPPSPQRPEALTIDVVVDDDQSDIDLDPARWARLARHALLARGTTSGELSLTFVDEATIAELNREHMGVDEPTDVLSFPLDADLSPGDVPADGVPVLLGDIVICPAVAARNAPDRLTTEPHPGHPTHDGSVDAELSLLVVHGVLHVLGMDHADPDQAAAMQAQERRILTTLADDLEVHRP
jgi:probable rRNA maturation factor